MTSPEPEVVPRHLDEMARSTLHQALIRPLVLERIPAWLSVPLVMLVAALPSILWSENLRISVAGMAASLAVLDWLSLRLLPVARVSYGPVNPPFFSLTFIRGGINGIVGLAGATWQGFAWLVVFQSVITIISIYTQWIEPQWITVTHRNLRSPRLHAGAPAIRMLHLGDLHHERPAQREERLQHLVRRLNPDLILFSGDFVSLSYNEDPETLAGARRIISEWKAPFGVYAVSGTPLVESSETVARILDGLNIRWLRDETVTLDIRGQRISVSGVSVSHIIDNDAHRMQRVVKEAPADSLRVLLFHAPDVAPQAAEAGVALYLCGHTHGGQIRLPFYGALITSSKLGKRYEMGAYRVGSMILYVTRGIGLEGASAPRARFLCPPEITLWTLEGES